MTGHYPPPPGGDRAQRAAFTFLGLAGGLAFLAVAVVIIVPLLCVAACCVFGFVAPPAPVSTPSPEVTLWP